MVLSPSAQRAWKTLTAVLSSATAFHCVFQVDYGDQEHVFTDLQKWYKTTFDRVLLGNHVVSEATPVVNPTSITDTSNNILMRGEHSNTSLNNENVTK